MLGKKIIQILVLSYSSFFKLYKIEFKTLLLFVTSNKFIIFHIRICIFIIFFRPIQFFRVSEFSINDLWKHVLFWQCKLIRERIPLVQQLNWSLFKLMYHKNFTACLFTSLFIFCLVTFEELFQKIYTNLCIKFLVRYMFSWNLSIYHFWILCIWMDKTFTKR